MARCVATTWVIFALFVNSNCATWQSLAAEDETKHVHVKFPLTVYHTDCLEIAMYFAHPAPEGVECIRTIDGHQPLETDYMVCGSCGRYITDPAKQLFYNTLRT